MQRFSAQPGFLQRRASGNGAMPLKGPAPDLQDRTGFTSGAGAAGARLMRQRQRAATPFSATGTCFSLAKKNAGNNAGAGMHLQKDQLIFRRIRCQARNIRE